MKEYKVVELYVPSVEEIENKMNDMAQDGWEVVSMSELSWSDSVLIAFVREK